MDFGLRSFVYWHPVALKADSLPPPQMVTVYYALVWFTGSGTSASSPKHLDRFYFHCAPLVFRPSKSPNSDIRNIIIAAETLVLSTRSNHADLTLNVKDISFGHSRS
jgi:hypothetical protein